MNVLVQAIAPLINADIDAMVAALAAAGIATTPIHFTRTDKRGRILAGVRFDAKMDADKQREAALKIARGARTIDCMHWVSNTRDGLMFQAYM